MASHPHLGLRIAATCLAAAAAPVAIPPCHAPL